MRLTTIPMPDSPGRLVRRSLCERRRVLAGQPFLAIRLGDGVGVRVQKCTNNRLTCGGPEVTYQAGDDDGKRYEV